MSISKKITEMKEPLTVDVQLIAAELDTSAKGLRFISTNEMTDAVMLDAFNSMVNDIENESGEDITSFDDYTILYEFEEEAVIVYSVLNTKYILYDVSLVQKMECKLNSYKIYE